MNFLNMQFSLAYSYSLRVIPTSYCYDNCT